MLPLVNSTLDQIEAPVPDGTSVPQDVQLAAHAGQRSTQLPTAQPLQEPVEGNALIKVCFTVCCGCSAINHRL